MNLDTPIELISRISDFQKSALKKLGILTVKNLLYHFPFRYGDSSPSKKIGDLQKGDSAVIFGALTKLKTSKAFRKKIPMAEGMIEDDTGRLKAVWFNQPYIAKMYPENCLVRAEGKISDRKGVLYISNPKLEKVAKLPDDIGDSLFANKNDSQAPYPVYPESRGVTSNWFYHTIHKVFKAGILDKIEDSIPTEILKKYNLPDLKTALIWIHAPQKESDAVVARKRFAFEEVFFIQIEKQQERMLHEKEPTFTIENNQKALQTFMGHFPFKPTTAQQNAIETILSDFSKNHPMGRLLEGDVGSGKTFVASATAYAVVATKPKNSDNKSQDYGNLQVAYMTPTEILAHQQFDSFAQNFTHLNINVGLITGSGCLKFPSKVNPKKATDISRSQLLKWVANGEIPILVGTHALIQKNVRFKHLAYIIIDEQHRFGTAQRSALATKDRLKPHLLSMTATPIPRTLALTIFGDLDLTLLDEMPPGRKPIITEIVAPENRARVYAEIKKILNSGRQAYIICPRIDEPDPAKEFALIAKSVTEEASRLKKEVFPEFEIGIMHSKLGNDEKEKVMEKFKNGETKILVSTSVVEVGVNVPNATIIIIEGAERFGLAQLHQLRGRVVRSTEQAYCYVFTESKSKNSIARLKALETAKNGFELAEKDLNLRGAGDLYGRKQWGISDVGMEALKNIKMVEVARAEAEKIITSNPDLKNFPLICKRLANQNKIHFE